MKSLALFLIAFAAYAQTYEVRGTVTEQGAGGISDVEVTVQRIEDGAAKKVRTDGQGAFRVALDTPGIYIAIAAKEGYTGGGPGLQPVPVAAGGPPPVVNITLTRMGEVSGRVVDEDTREPVAGVEITLFTKQWRYGQLSLNVAQRGIVRTDAEGRFRFTGMPPASYIASTRTRLMWIEDIKDFTKADIEKTDEDYPATYWPGGGDAASAFAATLTSGGYADIGTILVHKAPQYRIRAALQGSCPQGESVGLWVLRRNGGSTSSLGSFSCSGEVLLKGFDPGSYVLYAASERPNSELAATVSGAASVEVTDKNREVTLALQPNTVIEGQLVIAEGSTAPRVVPRIIMRPFDLLSGASPGGEILMLWAPDQRHFQLAVSPRTQSLLVSDTEVYVKEIRYNGTPLRGSTLPINPGAAAHKLEIFLDDKWGFLAGTVTDGSRGVPASVLIAKDSMRVEDLAQGAGSLRGTGADGTLPSTRLAPGDYRIVAVATAQAQRIHEAGVLERLLSTAQRFSIPPGGTQTVTIRLSDVR